LFCANQPASSTGSETSVAAAHSRARNRPSDEMKPTRKIGAVPALVAVRLTAKKNSFQAKMGCGPHHTVVTLCLIGARASGTADGPGKRAKAMQKGISADRSA